MDMDAMGVVGMTLGRALAIEPYGFVRRPRQIARDDPYVVDVVLRTNLADMWESIGWLQPWEGRTHAVVDGGVSPA